MKSNASCIKILRALLTVTCGCMYLQVHFGTQLAKMYLNADMYGLNCVTGMSCLFRKCILAEGGGLRALSQFLAEDYYLGQKCLER